MKRQSPELLAPAGDWKNLKAGLEAGADAVYFGVEGFNMRANAGNFRLRDLPRIRRLCDEHGAKAYLALNTIVMEDQQARMGRILAATKKAGIDAVIAADLAVIVQARSLGLEVHASTQLSVSNSAALLALHGLGVSRCVLARECSLEEVTSIRRSLRKRLGASGAKGLELELFAHGAMCVSVSGRCFMSEYDTGKSANQGACTQPCRREYKIVAERGGQEWILGKDYVMSPKDLCTLPFLDKLLATGADSLKIEGRNRSPEYVATVVGCYREALDFLCSRKARTRPLEAEDRKDWVVLSARLTERLATVYNRGFSSGFYCGKPIAEWTRTGGSEATHRKCLVGEVKNFYKKPSVAEILIQDRGFSVGDELLIEGHSTGFFSEKVASIQFKGREQTRAETGQSVGVKLSRQVRPGDKVYRLAPA